MPKRVQMTRKSPWRQDHPDAVIVDRRTPWGNPFIVGEIGVPDAWTAVELFRSAIHLAEYGHVCVTAEPSMMMHVIMGAMPGPIPRLDAIRTELRGSDLACWCPLDAPCHADILLEIANAN